MVPMISVNASSQDSFHLVLCEVEVGTAQGVGLGPLVNLLQVAEQVGLPLFGTAGMEVAGQ
jgi:hypothetical protein